MTVTIDTDAVINSILLTEQGSAPITPGAGLNKLYVTTNGLYLLNSAGAVIGPYITGTASGLSVGRVLISEQTPTGTGTVTWSSIPATYKDLELEYVIRGTQAAESVTASINFNADATAGNYRTTRHFGYGTNSSGASGADDAIFLDNLIAATSTAGFCTAGITRVINYASTSFHKVALTQFSGRSTTYQVQVGNNATYWESTTAINRIDIVLSAGNYDTGTTFRLYGVY